jgi:hypothetical protein
MIIKENNMKHPETMMIDDIKYVREDSLTEKAKTNIDGLEYKIVRTYSAGVFAGYLESREGKEVAMRDARRLWYWSGAASLSQLSVDGTKDPDKCKFPCVVDKVILTEAIEILDCTEKAKNSIEGVVVWQR